MTKKRILIIRNAYHHDFGGGERFPIELASELTKHDFEPTVISHSPKLLKLANDRAVRAIQGWWWSYQDFSGKRILLFPLYLIWQMLLFVWYLQLILRHQPDVVHPQSRDDFIAATFAAKIFGKRIVWTDHADLKYIWHNHRDWYKNPVGKFVYLASKFADYITLVSFNEKKHIEEQLGHRLSKKFVVIHNGVNKPKVDHVERSTADRETVTFVATSRLVTSKGIGELIEAFNGLSGNVQLWLLGEGPEESRFRELAKGNDHIHFLGFPDNALSYVAAADVFVHPSYHEGFSISLVEAASLGMPIIACDVGGNPEIVKSGLNGLLVPPKDATALREAMGKLTTHKELREEYGRNALSTYEQEFVFSRIVTERFLLLYE